MTTATFYLGGFNELNFRVQVVTRDSVHRYSSNTQPGLDKYMGNTQPVTYQQQMDLIRLDEFDRNWLGGMDLKLKENEIVCRYRTQTTVAGGITPLIKINVARMLAYFNEGEDDTVKFMAKGTKLAYLNIETQDL